MKPTILIIEDEGGIVDNIVYALKTEGYNTRWCSTGMEGLQAVKEQEIGLVLLDVGLPDINGFELFKDLKQVSDVPVIFLTARSEEIDRVVGLEIGADDYVTKPFSPRELTARVKAVLRRTGKPAADSAAAAESPAGTDPKFPFKYDDKKNAIFYKGVQLQTSRYEYRILKILIKHPGWVYSREQLMEMAWDEPDMSELRTVDAHIKNLRRKLKDITPDCDPIITHRGSGYALKEDW
ncbi:MAG: two-component system response regulator CreB [Candidatus Aminicenantes bacterium]|nr:MAG: two-component system response regulator CreB [Candidatus Aminicenantes bacterium]